MEIVSKRQSKRNPEVWHKIIRPDSGKVFCTCPACEHGGECYEMMKFRLSEERKILLKVKHEVSDIKIPDMTILRREQWAYIDQRNKQCNNAQILEARERALRVASLYKRVQVSMPSSTSSSKETAPVPATTGTRTRRKRMLRSFD